MFYYETDIKPHCNELNIECCTAGTCYRHLASIWLYSIHTYIPCAATIWIEVRVSRAEGQLALVRNVMASAIPGFHLTPLVDVLSLWLLSRDFNSLHRCLGRKPDLFRSLWGYVAEVRRLPASGRSLMEILFRSVLQNYVRQSSSFGW
jgi:hypothetical protein